MQGEVEKCTQNCNQNTWQEIYMWLEGQYCNNYQFMKQILSHHLQQLMFLESVLCLFITLQQRYCTLTALTSSFNFSMLQLIESRMTIHSLTDKLNTDWLANKLLHWLTTLPTHSLALNWIHLTYFSSAVNRTGFSQDLTATFIGKSHFGKFLQVLGWPWLLASAEQFPKCSSWGSPDTKTEQEVYTGHVMSPPWQYQYG
jgi:hypothetical protein